MPVDKHESFLQVDRFTLGMPSQTCLETRNNKFAISLQHLKENVNDEIDFLAADKHQRFLKIGTIILGVFDQACPNTENKFSISLQYLKKDVSQVCYFLLTNKYEILRQIDTVIFDEVLYLFSRRISNFFCFFIHCSRKSKKNPKFPLPHHWCCEQHLEPSFK